MGWKCYYEHRAICRHKTSETISTVQKKKKIAVIYDRNKMMMHAIHLNGWRKTGWYIQLFFECLFKLVSFNRTYLRSFSEFLKMKRKLKESKKRFDKLLETSAIKMKVPEVIRFIRNNIKQGYHIFYS
jgi:hypothetical protein